MKNSKRKIALLSSLTLFTTIAVSFSSITLAKYLETKKTDQSAWGLGGERMTSIFLNANIWKQGKDSSGNIVDASYYLYVWNTSDADGTKKIIAPSAHVTPTIGDVVMDLYVFEYDTTTLNRMIFLRWDPAIAPSTDLIQGAGHGNWNQTCDISYNSEINYYCIKGWNGATSGKSEYEYNRIDKAGNTLSWGNPSGSSTTIYS